MKLFAVFRKVFFFLLTSLAGLFTISCEMPATSFDKIEDAHTYTRSQLVNAPAPDSTVKVMTWNIRFGIARGPWFGDACGYKVIYSKDEILKNLQVIADHINQVQPDILLLEEVDLNSTRSAYVDELQWLLDHTQLNYAVYGSQWKAQYIASDGLGRMDEGNVILSRWPMTGAKRIQLDLRKDQDALVRYFYERCCMVEAKIQVPGFKDFYAVDIHTSAFATDDTKHQHMIELKNELDRISQENYGFIAGGDLNTLPPGSDSTDYCLEDMCPGESYHHPGDNPYHKDGSNYTPEKEWLVPMYSAYQCAVPLSDYQRNQQAFFTHCVRPEHFWDRTLDYLFTNRRWRSGSTVTHQDFISDSDHAPVSSEYVLDPK
jgi:endonuclease/exonuclease/phosphatase family metal-dependent hydrolase